MYESVILGLVLGLAYALVAQGFVLTYVATKTLNFALGEFMTVGAFIALGLASWSWLPAVPRFLLAIAIPGLLGGLVYRWLVQPFAEGGEHDVRWLLSTVALSFILLNLLTNAEGAEVRAARFARIDGYTRVVGVNVTTQQLLIAATALVVTVSLHIGLTRTRAGMKMRAVSENAETASLMGISPGRVTLVAWMAGMAIAALAGVLWAASVGLSPTLGQPLLIGAFAVAVIGGLTSIPAVLVGGAVYGVTTQVVGYEYGGVWSDVAGLAIVVLVLVSRPQGLLGRRIEGKV